MASRLAALIVALILAVGLAVFLWRRRDDLRKTLATGPRRAAPKMASTQYVRVEPPSLSLFYKSYSPFYPETPNDIAAIVESIARQTGLPRQATSYPTDLPSIESAAAAFQRAANEAAGRTALNLEDPDASQLDRFIDAFLIDPSLREFFADGKLRATLEGAASDRYTTGARESIHVPNEPLLIYALGAFYGQWLVRHGQCAWALYGPLNPVQSFPDMISAGATLCLHPFSQVNKKLSDPEGDNLAFKSRVNAVDKRSMPPYLLIASVADADHAVRGQLPPSARAALDAQNAGDKRRAFQLFSQAIAEHPDNRTIKALALPLAFEFQKSEQAAAWLDDLVGDFPQNPMFAHNRALLFPNTPEGRDQAIGYVRKAIDLDPNYARARITLASYLMETGGADEARSLLQWVIDHNPQLADEAKSLLARINR